MKRTRHDGKHLLHELQVVRLVEGRRKVGALEGQADLQQQVQPRVRDVALRVPEGPVANRCKGFPSMVLATTAVAKLLRGRSLAQAEKLRQCV